MARQRVVITGLGAVTAAGLGHEPLWSALRRGEPLFSPITRFSPRETEPQRAAQIRDFSAEAWLAPAQARQTDISTHFGFASTRLALRDAGVDIEQVDTKRVSVLVGHAFGGMDYAEQQLYNQWVLGPEEVGPYQAIAWFYAAAMGQLSIQLGLNGYSKAFVADRASSMHAIGHGYRILQSGRADLCIAGGVEAPLSPFMYRTVVSAGQVSSADYAPFSRKPTGFVMGEGSCFLILETLDHARRRGARVYAEIGGYGMTTDHTAGHGLSGAADSYRCQRLALDEGATTSRGVDHVFADGVALAEPDLSEFSALRQLFESNRACRVSVPKTVVGELYGAGAVLQVLAGALSIHTKTCLPLGVGAAEPDGILVPHASTAVEQSIQRVLINSRGIGGVNASLVLKQLPSNDL